MGSSSYLKKDFIKSNVVFLAYNIIKKVRLTKKPTVLQLPILSKCNYACVMCNVPNMDPKGDFTPDELGRYLSDPIFSNVRAVGVNGGEPFMLKNFIDYIDEVLKLKKLKSIHIITNGSYPDRISNKMKDVYLKCKKQNVKVNISISIDGYGIVHDNVRGKKGAFENWLKTINILRANEHYDFIDFSCTVSKMNVSYLSELESFARSKNIKIRFRLAVENKRIDNLHLKNDFFVGEDLHFKMLAQEFFYKQIFATKDVRDIFKYWSIFEFLRSNMSERHLGCAWKGDGITLDPKGNIYYCATKSNKIGSLLYDNGESIYFNDNNLRYRDSIVKNECDSCIHDYTGAAKFKSIFKFYTFILSKRFWHIGMKGQ